MDLYGCKGCGSLIVEALLEMAGTDYRNHVFAWEDDAAWQRLKAVNPLGQVPTLVLDDGTVMTESAAIALWIADRSPDAKLLPDDPRERALAYRWLVSFATNVYVPVIVGDFPERWVDGDAARESLKLGARRRLEAAWLAFEADVSPSPYLAGDRISVLDVYVAVIARWRPGRAWLALHCPKTIGAVTLAESHPVVAAVWDRHRDDTSA